MTAHCSVAAAVLVIALRAATALAGDQPITTLRLQGQPHVTSEQILTPRVTAVSATVKNVGGAEAMGIQVTAILPDGKREALFGPHSLPKNQSATYSSPMYALITKQGKVNIEIRCENCR